MLMEKSSISLRFRQNKLLPALYGEKNSNLQLIERFLNVIIASRGNYLAISGESDGVAVAAKLLESMYNKLESGAEEIAHEDIKSIVSKIHNNTNQYKSEDVEYNEYVLKTKKRNVFAYTDSQFKYIKCMHHKDITFAIGGSGTGKSYLAVAMAVSMFIEKKVNRIILTRPVVEAGEKLGFLPGDVKEKVDPYLQPLYDALYEMLPAENVERYLATKELQIVPLAFMRGRTLSNSFIILDEGQNVTITQMKMFLTRLGANSKMVITGDLTQIDLPPHTESGLIDAIEKLKKLKEISVIKFEKKDVVRHPIIAKIIDAYEN